MIFLSFCASWCFCFLGATGRAEQKRSHDI
jgi:hypothetical protein